MILDYWKLVAVACAVVIGAPSLALASKGTGMPQVPAAQDRLAKINEKMGLTHSSILRLDVAPGVSAEEVPETLVMLINDAPMIVRVQPHSVRHENYRVYAQIADGSLVEVEPTPVNTLRGEVVGIPDAVVTGSMESHGLHMRIALPGGDEYWIEPLRRRLADAAEDEYVLYNLSHVRDCRGGCGLEQLPDAMMHRPFLGEPAPGEGGIASGGLKIAELACDADFEFFQHWGSSVTNVANRINSIINANNSLYEMQTGLTHQITTIIVRTSSNQPYTHTRADRLLNQFRNHWNANHGNVQRDLAHLFTGKSLAGNTIGIAWVGVVCNLSYAYALSQSTYSSNFACVTDLTAHELGHNWNAPHCSCPSHTMNPSITCANNFHSSSINTIVQFANSRTCLDEDGGEPPATGACCTYQNGCVELTAANCSSQNGTYQGDGTTCAVQPHGCPPCEIQDCNGNCAPAIWVGDGLCDDGTYAFEGNAIYFNCEEFDCDGGDCVCDDPGDPGPGDPPPGDPTSMSVASIAVSTFNAGQGRHRGQAVVTILNDAGQPVSGVTVTGTFSAPYNETRSGVTNAQGQATIDTVGVKQGGNVNFTFCVTSVTGGDLPYAPDNNAVTCAP